MGGKTITKNEGEEGQNRCVREERGGGGGMMV